MAFEASSIGNPHYGFKASSLPTANSSFPLFYIQPLRETTLVIDTPDPPLSPLPSIESVEDFTRPIIRRYVSWAIFLCGFSSLFSKKKKEKKK